MRREERSRGDKWREEGKGSGHEKMDSRSTEGEVEDGGHCLSCICLNRKHMKRVGERSERQGGEGEREERR